MKIFYDIDKGVEGVRIATPADEEQIFALLCHLHAENGMFNLSTQKLVDAIRHGTERKGGIIFVIEEAGWVVATLGIIISTNWYSDDEYLTERWNIVHPDYRSKGNYARKLLEQAKWTSDHFTRQALADGRPPVPYYGGITTFNRTEGKVRLYARHMACIGAYFMYGQLPLQNEKMQREMKRIEETNLRTHRERSREVVPVVESIIRVSQRGQREGSNGRS